MRSTDAHPQRPPRSRAEWWTFAVAVSLIGLVAGAIILGWATGATGPPVIEAGRSGAIQQEGALYRVPFEVRNVGGDAATSVQVVAELTIDGKLEGSGEQGFMFLSGGGRESGAFLFGTDPALGTLTISVASYANP